MRLASLLLLAVSLSAAEQTKEEQDAAWAKAMAESAAAIQNRTQAPQAGASAPAPLSREADLARQRQEAAVRSAERKAKYAAAEKEKAIQAAVQAAEQRLSTARARLAEMSQRIQQLDTWIQSTTPMLQQKSLHQEALRMQYNAAIDRWNQEVAAMGPRRTGRNFYGTQVQGGPTDATMALAQGLEQQLKAATADLQQTNAQYQQALSEKANIQQVAPSWNREEEVAIAELNRSQAIAAQANQQSQQPESTSSQVQPQAQLPAQATGIVGVRDKIRDLALRGKLASLSVVGSDGRFLGNCDPSELNAKSIVSTVGEYGQRLGTYGASLWNKYGDYGSPYALASANNPHALDSPILIADGVTIGKLTANKFTENGITLPELINLLSSAGR